MISGQVIKKEIDSNGNIKVETEYTLTDGSKQIGHTRYDCFNYSEAQVLADIRSQCENLIRKTYNLKQCQTIVAEPLPSISYQCSEVEVVTKPAIMDAQGLVLTPAETMTIDDK
jgi:hypothetical protein